MGACAEGDAVVDEALDADDDDAEKRRRAARGGVHRGRGDDEMHTRRISLVSESMAGEGS